MAKFHGVERQRRKSRLRSTLALVALLTLAAAAQFAPLSEARAQIGAASAAPGTAPSAAPAMPQDTLNHLVTEAQGWLGDLIRIDTTNPPGNELAAAKYVAAVLQKENIPVEVIEIAPGRGVAIAELQAGPLRDPSKALLLVAHLDVVGVDKSKWSVDPFGGVVKEGYLYGRGAIDDKGMLAANLATMVELKRAGVRLNRDVIFLADDDEEQGGAASIKLVIDKYWDKIGCAFAINEGGRVIVKNGKVQYVGIQASEKVSYDVAVIATGPSGHGSMPRPDNSVVHLAAAVQKLGTMETPVQLMTITRRYFEQLAQVEDDDTGKWMRALETPERFELAARRLSDMSPMWNSMLRDSIAPTELRAGVRANVVPSESWANLNIRLLPGNPISGVIAQMQKVVNDPQIKFEIQPDSGQSAPPSSLTSELYQAIERAVPQQFAGAAVVPFLSTGATDSAELRLHSVQSYGLLPFPLTEADEQRMHADDERISLSSFRTGIEFLYRTIHDFVAAR
jgi:acetylornithine deacetylase/succinyl-diaminopimelate desuccinylase-like protein